MLVHQAEQSFQQGIEALSRGQTREALAFFGGAIEIETQSQPTSIQARYLSYYGLCLALTGGDLHEFGVHKIECTDIEGRRDRCARAKADKSLGEGNPRVSVVKASVDVRGFDGDKTVRAQELRRIGDNPECQGTGWPAGPLENLLLLECKAHRFVPSTCYRSLT